MPVSTRLTWPTVARLARDCGAILHFGGISNERPFDELRGPNIDGVVNVPEAARHAHARVVFASSNHAFGFYPRSATLDVESPFRPDGFYGLSKAFGEVLAQLYWDKHGVETVSIRIGSARDAPVDARMLATWLSLPDLVELVIRAVSAETVGYSVIWGTSRNAQMTWWTGDARTALGWSPDDSADPWASTLAGHLSNDAMAEALQGGKNCTIL